MTDDDIREGIDYIVRRLKKLILEPESLVAKDLAQLGLRIEEQEEKLAKIIERIENLEKKIEEKKDSDSFSWF